MDSFGWGLIGPGLIAHRFADAVHRLPHTRLVAVAGRDPGRASAFARHWSRDGVPDVEVADGVEALLARDDVRAVYIATPHAAHADAIAACLARGKAVLCEKPLVPTRAHAEPLVVMARERRVFLMEAVWTRFLPIYEVVWSWLEAGAIGRVRAMQSSFCFNLPFDAAARHFDPAQAGGALLDVGVYNLTVTRWALAASSGACPPLTALHATGTIGPTGVDHRVAAQLTFEGGVDVQFVCAFDGHAPNAFLIHGERGTIAIPDRFWEATEAALAVDGEPTRTEKRPFAINGFEGEVLEVIARVRAGDIESPIMPHAESLATLGWMDEIRRRIGVRYPFE